MITLYKNKEVECAVLAVVFQTSDTDRLWELDDNDFADEGLRFLRNEINELVTSGLPLGDPCACSTWFASEGAKARAKTIGIDSLPAYAAEVFGLYATAGNWRYYLSVLRAERLRRALQSLSRSLEGKLTGDPQDALIWLTEQAERLNINAESMATS